MKILLDHCVPKRLSRHLPTHSVRTARQMGWDGLKNGKLLSQAAGQFNAILTVDRKIKHQQNLATLPLSVVILVALSNRLADLIPLIPELERALLHLQPGQLVEVRFSPP